MPERIPFRNRAHEVSRIEAFSDVVFGFAISLLVVSLEAPKTYAQMMEMLRGFCRSLSASGSSSTSGSSITTSTNVTRCRTN